MHRNTIHHSCAVPNPTIVTTNFHSSWPSWHISIIKEGMEVNIQASITTFLANWKKEEKTAKSKESIHKHQCRTKNAFDTPYFRKLHNFTDKPRSKPSQSSSSSRILLPTWTALSVEHPSYWVHLLANGASAGVRHGSALVAERIIECGGMPHGYIPYLGKQRK